MKKIDLQKLYRGGWANNRSWNNTKNEWNKSSFYDPTDYQKLLTVLNGIQNKMPTMKKGSNIMIDKSSEIPRPKLKEFINDNGYNKVTLLSKANIIAIRRETVKQLQAIQLETVKLVCSSDTLSICGGNYNAELADRDNPDQDYTDVLNRCIPTTGYRVSGYRNAKQAESINFILSLVGTKATLVYDDCLLGEINSDGLDLDDDIYETIEGMLLSKDISTFYLGIEMLSNMNIENNLFKISILMNQTFNQTSRLNSLSYIKNNNFKSLLSYLKANDIRWNQNWESYGMSMLVKFNNTEYRQNVIDYVVKNMNIKFSKLGINGCKEIVSIGFK
jgi:hypothetical protein